MTSWIKQAPAKKKEEDAIRPFLFETTDSGFCGQFNAYLHSVLFSISEDVPLVVNDSVNSVGIRYPLIQNTFVKIPSVSFTDANILTAINLKKRQLPVMTFVQNMSNTRLRTMGQEVFKWNPAILQDTLDASGFDVGVHIRTYQGTDRKNATIEQYVNAIQSYQKSSKKAKLQIFVMADSFQRLEEFRRKKDASWTIKTIGNPAPGGHSQRDFNAMPSRARMAAYLEFVGELQLMQKMPQIFCSLSSNVGKFLFVSTETNIIAVDVPAAKA